MRGMVIPPSSTLLRWTMALVYGGLISFLICFFRFGMFLDLCFPAALLLGFSASPRFLDCYIFCFSDFPSFAFLLFPASLLLAFLLFCLSASPRILLLCFLLFCFSLLLCFSAFLLSLLFLRLKQTL